MSNHPLLDEIFADQSEIRATTLAQALHHARIRRQSRHAVQALAAIAILFVTVSIIFRPAHQHAVRPVASAVTARSYQTVVSVPIPSSEQIFTRALPSSSVIGTRPLSSSALVSSNVLSPSSLVATGQFAEVITTTPDNITRISTIPGQYHPLTDTQLLTFTAGRPAILIRISPDSERLVFAGEPNLSSASP